MAQVPGDTAPGTKPKSLQDVPARRATPLVPFRFLLGNVSGKSVLTPARSRDDNQDRGQLGPSGYHSSRHEWSSATFLGSLLGRWHEVTPCYYDAGLQGTEWRQNQHEFGLGLPASKSLRDVTVSLPTSFSSFTALWSEQSVELSEPL